MNNKPSIPFDIAEKYVLFSTGDANPKGGCYSFNHLENVYIVDEKKSAVVHDETLMYAWLMVQNEGKRRRKMKHKLKRLRS